MKRTEARRDPRAAGILSRAVVRAAGVLDLSQKDVGLVLGVSEATATRLFRGRPVDPGRKEGELAVLFLRLYRSLDTILAGNEADMRLWMHSENDHVGGIPARLIRSVTGLFHVTGYLDAMRGKL